MKPKTAPRKWAVFAFLCFVVPHLATAELSLDDLSVRIAPRNAYYTLDSIRESSNPGFLEFTVHSAHADYKVEGVLPLVKLLHEIEVVEKIRRNEDTSGFFDGAASSVENTADGFVKLITNPIESGKGLGKAAGKLGSSISGIFRDKEEGEKGDSWVAKSERELAKNYKVDVYTDNPYLKKLLKSMARSRAGGKGMAAIASFLIPVGAVAGVALTASSVNGTADQIVNDSSRPEIFKLNKQALLELKMPVADVERFINSKVYSPREATYIRTYLEKLRFAANFRDVFKTASEIQNLEDAEKILWSLQIAAQEAQKDPYLFDSIEIKGDGIWARAEQKLIWILPYDYLQNNRHGDLLLQQAVDEWKIDPKRQFEIWSAGQVTQDFLRAASARGVKVQWFKLWGGAKSGQI